MPDATTSKTCSSGAVTQRAAALRLRMTLPPNTSSPAGVAAPAVSASPPPAHPWRSRLVRALWTLLVLAAVVPVLQISALRVVDPPVTYTMLERSWEHPSKNGEWLSVKQRTISFAEMGYAPRAAVASEDGMFWVHQGFDWRGVCNAIEARREGKRLRGASTISQQVAKNVFLTQHRSWLRKGAEAYYTVLLELIVPKERILEVYLNVAEMGPQVFGIEAAAQHWYGKPASKLSKNEAARIIAILPSPQHWSPSGSQGNKRSRHIRNNAVPFPGDPGFESTEERWQKVPWPWACESE